MVNGHLSKEVVMTTWISRRKLPMTESHYNSRNNRKNKYYSVRKKATATDYV